MAINTISNIVCDSIGKTITNLVEHGANKDGELAIKLFLS
jgi:hypothetical protein